MTTFAPHPRLLLDADRLATIRAADAGALKAWCDACLAGTIQPYSGNQYPDVPGIGAGYQGESYVRAVLNFALLYQVTGDARYGDKAVAIMLAMSNPVGAASPSVDSGYIIRNYGLAYGLGFDWCYDRMTPAQRTQIIASANAHIAYWEAGKAFESEPTAGNYYAGYFCAKALCALAMQEDNPKAPAQWADWRNAMFPAIVAYYDKHMDGGGWPEGFGYGPLAISNMAMPIWAALTATGEDLTPAFPFPVDCAEYVMHATWPGLQYIDDRDLLHSSGDAASVPNALSSDLLALLGTMLDVTQDARAPAFRGFRLLRQRNPPGLEWRRVLYANNDLTAAPLTDHSYFAPGMGQMFARSGWDDAATWLSYRAAASAGYPDAGEQLFDQGGLAIVNGAKPFVLNAWGAGVREPGGNAFESAGLSAGLQSGDLDIFNVLMTGSGGQVPNTEAAVQTVFEEHGNWCAARSTGLEQMYRAGVTSWNRDVVYLRPGVVIVRDAFIKDNTDAWLQWHVPAATIDGAQVETGAGRVTVAWPQDAAIKAVPIFANSQPVKVRQLQVRGTGGVVVTVFDTSATPAEVSCSDGATVRVGSRTVVFAASGITVDGAAPAPAPAPSPAPAPAPAPAPPPPAEPTAAITVTRKGRWQIVGGTAHNTSDEAIEYAANLALASPGTVVAIQPPALEVVAKA